MKKLLPYAGSGVVLLLIVTLVWMNKPTDVPPEEPPAQPQLEQSARTVKSRRKQRLRQQRCRTAATAKLQAVQKKLAEELTRSPANSPTIQNLRSQEKAELAAVESCGQPSPANQVTPNDDDDDEVP